MRTLIRVRVRVGPVVHPTSPEYISSIDVYCVADDSSYGSMSVFATSYEYKIETHHASVASSTSLR